MQLTGITSARSSAFTNFPQAVPLGRCHLDQRLSAERQLPQLGRAPVRRGPWVRPDYLGKPRQHFRVQDIRFGPVSRRFGEIPDPTGFPQRPFWEFAEA